MTTRQEYFRTWCKRFVKENERSTNITSGWEHLHFWVWDFCIDARDDKSMPKRPKKWRQLKEYLREMDACKEAIAASWAAYMIWKNGQAHLSSFMRRANNGGCSLS